MRPAKCVYLFNSAPPERPAYRRGVLEALSYPIGHRLVMSYEKTFIQDELREPGCLKNRDAAFIFLDRTPGDPEFIPIRLAKVVDCLWPSQNRVELRVELLQLVRPENALIAKIKQLEKRPARNKKLGSDYYYVLEANPSLSAPAVDESEEDIWEQLAESVRASHTLSDSVLMSLSHLRHYGSGRDCKLRVFKGRDKVYGLRPNTTYEMDVRVTTAQTNLAVQSSSDLLGVTEAFPTTIGGLATYRVIISCKRTLESSLAAIFVGLADVDRPSGEAKQDDRRFYLAQISPSRRLLGSFLLAVFAGVFSSSLSKEFFQHNPKFAFGIAIENATVFSKVVGAALLAFAAWLGLRKLPSGASGG
jgi:hypothetical protein